VTDDEYDQWLAKLVIRGNEAWLPPELEYRWKVRETGAGWRREEPDESDAAA
jgi:hypothetical protein